MYHPYYRFTNGGFIPPPTPPTTPTALIWGDRNGPYLHWGYVPPRLRKKIPDDVVEIIEEIAAPIEVSTNLELKPLVDQEAELRAELKTLGLAWRKVYKEALIEIYEQQQEDEAVVLMLMDF